MTYGERFDQLLQRELQEYLEDLEEAVADGQATNWGEYTNLTGQIRGIRYSINALIRMRKKIIEEPDEDV